VAPLPEWVSQYGVRSNECNLVGMVKNNADGWNFAIHPAVANTRVARDLMAQDMLLSGLAKTLGSRLPKYDSYRWFDRPTSIGVNEGRTLEVISADGRAPSVLGFSLWTPGDLEGRYAAAIKRHNDLARNHNQLLRELTASRNFPDSFSSDRKATWDGLTP